MPWDINKPAGTDAANTIDDSVIANNTALDTWASAITDGIAQAGATIFKMYRAANATIAKFRADAADTFDRFTYDLNGKLSWGPGTGAQDVVLERTAVGILKTSTGRLDGQYGPFVQVYDRATAGAALSNTVTETTVYSKTITGGTLGTNGTLRLTLLGKLTNTSGTTRALTLRLKYGATTLVAAVGNNNGGQTDNAVAWVCYLIANAATNAQVGYVAHPAPEVLTDAQAMTFRLPSRGASTEDSTADKTLVVSLQWNLALTTLSVTLEHATLEYLP